MDVCAASFRCREKKKVSRKKKPNEQYCSPIIEMKKNLNYENTKAFECLFVAFEKLGLKCDLQIVEIESLYFTGKEKKIEIVVKQSNLNSLSFIILDIDIKSKELYFSFTCNNFPVFIDNEMKEFFCYCSVVSNFPKFYEITQQDKIAKNIVNLKSIHYFNTPLLVRKNISLYSYDPIEEIFLKPADGAFLKKINFNGYNARKAVNRYCRGAYPDTANIQTQFFHGRHYKKIKGMWYEFCPALQSLNSAVGFNLQDIQCDANEKINILSGMP